MSLHIGIIADLLKLPLENSIIRCAELGAKGVQLYAVKGEMKPENMSSEKIAHIRELLVNNGLELSALCADYGGTGFADPSAVSYTHLDVYKRQRGGRHRRGLERQYFLQ